MAYCLRGNPGRERGGQQLSTGTRSSTLRVKGAHDIITAIAAAAGLEDDTTVHVLKGSRARCLAVLVCSPQLLTIRCRSVEQMRLVNALGLLVELAQQ